MQITSSGATSSAQAGQIYSFFLGAVFLGLAARGLLTGWGGLVSGFFMTLLVGFLNAVGAGVGCLIAEGGRAGALLMPDAGLTTPLGGRVVGRGGVVGV